jgi:hypothetical protein
LQQAVDALRHEQDGDDQQHADHQQPMIWIDGSGDVPDDHEGGNAEQRAGKMPDAADGQHHKPFGGKLETEAAQTDDLRCLRRQGAGDAGNGAAQRVHCQQMPEHRRTDRAHANLIRPDTPAGEAEG